MILALVTGILGLQPTIFKDLAMAIRAWNGHTPKVGKEVFVDDAAVVIGEVSLGDYVSIWPAAVLRGDVNHIHIGDYSNVQDGAVVHCTHKSEANPAGWPTVIGQRVTVGHQACLHGCTIGDRVLIGIGATVLDGAVIEDNVVIAAGTLVPPGKRLESGYMYMGSPAKQARPLSDKELAFFEYTTDHYVKLQATHRVLAD